MNVDPGGGGGLSPQLMALVQHLKGLNVGRKLGGANNANNADALARLQSMMGQQNAGAIPPAATQPNDYMGTSPQNGAATPMNTPIGLAAHNANQVNNPYSHPLPNSGFDPHEQQARAARGLAYANASNSKFAKIAALTGNDAFQALFAGHGAKTTNVDNPLAMFTAASGQFTQIARANGFNDPRQYMLYLLQKAKGG